MFGLHAQELLIIAVLVLFLFGSKKIPDLLGGLGKGIRDFKKGLKGGEPEADNESPEKIKDESSSNQ